MANIISMPLPEKIGQLFMIGFPDTKIQSPVLDFINHNNIGFIILFTRNIESPGQVTTLTNELHSLGSLSPLVYVDQEGGKIVRFKEMAATVISHMGIAATGDPLNAFRAGQLIGRDMNLCGIDGVFAPVLDVNRIENNPIIGIRSFSDQPEIVSQYALRFLDGLKQEKILACGKHFPGHGMTLQDSHVEIPSVDISMEYFDYYCYSPFEKMFKKGIDSIMTSHILFPRITNDIATFSGYFIQDLCRKKSHYNGVVFSDCLEMNAVKEHFTPEEIVMNSMKSGIDVLVVSHSLEFQKELFDILIFQVRHGIIEEKRIDESLARIIKLKNKFQTLGYRKSRDQNTVANKIRRNLNREQKMSDESITLLRDNHQILPLNKEGKTLILEWTRCAEEFSVVDDTSQSMISELALEYFDAPDIYTVPPLTEIPAEFEVMLAKYAYVIACIYDFDEDMNLSLYKEIHKLINIRKDLIIVSLESPYAIKHFWNIDTYIVTYGSKKIQIHSLFKLLTGKIKSKGKIPIEIKDLFPRNYYI